MAKEKEMLYWSDKINQWVTFYQWAKIEQIYKPKGVTFYQWAKIEQIYKPKVIVVKEEN